VTIAFYLPGGVPIYAFSLILALGATLGLVWVAWRAPAKQVLLYLDAGLLALLGGLLGGRAAFVATNWVYYQSHLLEILAVHRGGYSWVGALAGGLLALALVAVIKHISLGLLADSMLPLMATLTVAGWLGCWLGGCAYGPRTDGWWGFPVSNEWGRTASRWPTQLLGALLTLVLFWLLDWSRAWLAARDKSPRSGTFVLLGVLLLSLEMFALSYLRVDYTYMWNGFRLEAWAALGFATLAALALVVSLIMPRRERQVDEGAIWDKERGN
jgi:phosphatidylglycerol:prolipoprotein diacylglycerol transferase